MNPSEITPCDLHDMYKQKGDDLYLTRRKLILLGYLDEAPEIFDPYPILKYPLPDNPVKVHMEWSEKYCTHESIFYALEYFLIRCIELKLELRNRLFSCLIRESLCLHDETFELLASTKIKIPIPYHKSIRDFSSNKQLENVYVGLGIISDYLSDLEIEDTHLQKFVLELSSCVDELWMKIQP